MSITFPLKQSQLAYPHSGDVVVHARKNEPKLVQLKQTSGTIEFSKTALKIQVLVEEQGSFIWKDAETKKPYPLPLGKTEGVPESSWNFLRISSEYGSEEAQTTYINAHGTRSQFPIRFFELSINNDYPIDSHQYYNQGSTRLEQVLK